MLNAQPVVFQCTSSFSVILKLYSVCLFEHRTVSLWFFFFIVVYVFRSYVRDGFDKIMKI